MDDNSQLPAIVKRGAPSKKTPELCKAICDGIAEGKSSRKMCQELGIAQNTFWTWLQSDTDLQEQYARAKDLCADYYAEQIPEIADDSVNDWQIREDGTRYVDNEAVQRSRLRIDARKWYASKVAPKKYGDKIENVHSGDPDKPIQKNITISFRPGIPDK